MTMVALIPPRDVAEQVALPGGEAVDDLHVTLAYLPDGADTAKLVSAVTRAIEEAGPLTGVINGVARFSGDGPEGDPVVLTVDLPALPELRQRLVSMLSLYGLPPSEKHGFVPHMTIAYVSEEASTPRLRQPTVPVSFDGLWVVNDADERRFVPFPEPAQKSWWQRLKARFTTVPAELSPKKPPPKAKPPVVIPIPGSADWADNLANIAEDAIRAYVNPWTESIASTTYRAIQDLMVKAREEGNGVEWVLEQIQPLFSPERAEMIAITETTRLFGIGAQAVYNALDAPGWRWQTVEDDWVCPECEDMNDTEFDIDVDFEPLHPRCIFEDAAVAGGSVLAATRRVYEGEIITLSTTAGDELSVTPNHPILTARGWVAAGLLVEGDEVVCDNAREPALSTHPDDVQLPAHIKEIWEALSVSPSMDLVSMPVSPEDFHGDGGQSEVEVVLPHAVLRHRGHSSCMKNLRQRHLVRASAAAVGLTGVGAENPLLGRLLAPSRRFVGSLNLSRSPLRRPHRTLQLFSFLPSTGRHPQFEEATADYQTVDVESLSERVLTLPGEVAASDLLAVERMAVRGWGTRRLAVVSRRVQRGHVYNLQTAEGWFSANGIVTHNCRCFPRPAVAEVAAEGAAAGEEDLAA